MNAYELAEKLNDAVNKNEKHVTLDIQAMLMLRQQADRIAELGKQLEDCVCQGGHSEAYLKAKGRLK